MANVSSNMLITDNSLSQISQKLLSKEDIYFTFPYLLIGDGKYPLADNSEPIFSHCYSFPIKEINRSNNNVLLVTTIDENAYLTIREMALYCNYGDGTTHIFSKIGGLNVKKGKDLAYNLIIHINLDINAVNTVAMPEIIVKEATYPSFSEFQKVKDVYAYTVENLERMIKTNALGIGCYNNQDMTERKPVGVGYNTAQTYYSLQDKLNLWEDDFCATFNYTSIQDKFKESIETEKIFDLSSLDTFGGAEVNADGEGTIHSESGVYVENEALIGNSSSYYVDTENQSFISPNKNFFVNTATESLLNTQVDRIEVGDFEPINFNSWDFSVSFTTGEAVNSEGTILNLQNNSQYQPLVLGTQSGYCFLELGGVATLQTHLGSKEILFNNGTANFDNYVEWVAEDEEITNLHVIKIGNPEVINTVISNFSNNNYLSIPSFNPVNKTWEIGLNFITGGTLGGTLFNFGKTGTPIYGINCYISENKVKVDLSFNGTSISETLLSANELSTNSQYNLKVIFDGEKYDLYINNELEDSINSTTSIWNESTGVAYLGKEFTGSIDLKESEIKVDQEKTWTGSITSNSVLTYDSIPTTESKFFDLEKYEISNLALNNYFQNEILNENLFPLTPETKYTVKGKYENGLYTLEYSENGRDFIEVLNYESTEMINNVSKIVIGSQYNTELSSYLSPYSGVLNLKEFEIDFYRYNTFGFIEEQSSYKFYYTVSHTTGIALKDFYHIPEYVFSSFKVNDLNNDNSSSVLEVYEGYMQGRGDDIDFNSSTGFTICVKTFLKDLKDKLILAKRNIKTGDSYFILKEEDESIVLEYFLGDSVFTLSKKINIEEAEKFISYPITLYITCDEAASPTLKMYKNSELIAERQAPKKTSLKAEEYYLTNQSASKNSISDERTIHYIMGFSGVLELKDLYYINNLLDTNF